jgi:hypothetical protein
MPVRNSDLSRTAKSTPAGRLPAEGTVEALFDILFQQGMLM